MKTLGKLIAGFGVYLEDAAGWIVELGLDMQGCVEKAEHYSYPHLTNSEIDQGIDYSDS